ncbi:hypothetical protein Tco_1160304, partial [Tanacetum coccineum]
VNIDDPNITMEECIRLEEEKAHRRGKVYNWETTTYDPDPDLRILRYCKEKTIQILGSYDPGPIIQSRSCKDEDDLDVVNYQYIYKPATLPPKWELLEF